MSADKYYVVTAAAFEVTECQSKDELLEKLRALKAAEKDLPLNNRVCIIGGSRIFLSKGEYKYVLFPDSGPMPVDLMPDVFQPDEEGLLVEEKKLDREEVVDVDNESNAYDDEEEDEFS